MASIDKRNRLIEQILEWNSSRLDLFELSIPNERCEFNGVMRFFLQDDQKRFQTKCIRVSSEEKTSDVILVLKEKFFPLDPNKVCRRFGIYEHHANGARRLTSDEHPLLVQLNWSKLDREGKFVLKLEGTTLAQQQICNGNNDAKKVIEHGTSQVGFSNFSGRMKHRWSLRREKAVFSTPVREKNRSIGCAAAIGPSRDRSNRTSPNELTFSCFPKAHHGGSNALSSIRRDRYLTNPTGPNDSPPDSSFTRTISNPEAVMRRKRQRTLEAKLLQILEQEGSDGGTLKIYGGHICPDVPYKTLLLSAVDSVAMVIRQSLDKYGLDEADADAYCLVMRVRNTQNNIHSSSGTEEILQDSDHPLKRLFAASAEVGNVVTFELRQRPPHLLKRRPFSGLSTPSIGDHCISSNLDPQLYSGPAQTCASNTLISSGSPLTAFACLIELNCSSALDGHSAFSPMVYPLPIHKGQVCVGTATEPNDLHHLLVTLPASSWPGVEQHHMVIWQPPVHPGITATMAAIDATTKRGGWLACRPCPLPVSDRKEPTFATVYVNDCPLQRSVDNLACVYWLAPGDVIRLGESKKLLKIWPGSGKPSSSLNVNVRSPIPINSQQFDRPTPRFCPAVPKHQRVYDPIVSSPTTKGSVGPLDCSPKQDRRVQHEHSFNMVSRQRNVNSGEVIVHHPQAFHSFGSFQSNDGSTLHSSTESPSQSSSSSLSSSRSHMNGNSPLRRCQNELLIQPSELRASTTVNNIPCFFDPMPPKEMVGVKRASVSTESSWSPQNYSNRLNVTAATSNSTAAYSCTAIPKFNPIPQPNQPRQSDILDQMSTSVDVRPNADTTRLSLSSSTERTRPASSLLDTAQFSTSTITSACCTPKHTITTTTRSSRSGRTKYSSTVSDRLPCQLAFAPASVGQLLDRTILKHLQTAGRDKVLNPSERSDIAFGLNITCPLGSAMTVYLMLRAVCRQCDRWETIESNRKQRKGTEKFSVSSSRSQSTPSDQPVSNSGVHLKHEFPSANVSMLVHQRKRRQRELLNVMVHSVERFQNFEQVVSGSMKSLELLYASDNTDRQSTIHRPVQSNHLQFMHVLLSVAVWLSNASQLLHLVTRDVDLCKIFQPEPSSDILSDDIVDEQKDEAAACSAWTLLHEQLADVVQIAFTFLTDLCVSRLDRDGIPQLLSDMQSKLNSVSPPTHSRLVSDKSVSNTIVNASTECDNWLDADVSRSVLGAESDTTLGILTNIMDCLHVAYTNPAFVVQLFAHLLHRLNARLFNFVLGTACETEESNKIDDSHVSPAWGHMLQRWIHVGLNTWAKTQGLGMAVECYMQRASQAAELMLADTTSVESLYNVAVDLVGLNSNQVRTILERYSPRPASNDTMFGSSEEATDNAHSSRIPKHWIDFVVSGVQMVADRILAEEQSDQAVSGTESDPELDRLNHSWTPSLDEPLKFCLPLLLPEDSYPSDNPIPSSLLEEDELISCDSGISSRSDSAKYTDLQASHDANKQNVDALITIDSLRRFLDEPIKAGWCRLSVRPTIPKLSTNSHPTELSKSPVSTALSWSVYLNDSQASMATAELTSPLTPVPNEDEQVLAPTSNVSYDAECKSRSPNYSDQPNVTSSHPPAAVALIDSTADPISQPSIPIWDESVQTHSTNTFSVLGANINDSFTRSLCSRHRPLTIVVPKIGQSLGLSIVAAKSEDGRDLGIYVRGVIPDSGASYARLVETSLSDHPSTDDFLAHAAETGLLQPGDHLLAVDQQVVTGLSQEAAVQLVASAGPKVYLTVVRNPDIHTALYQGMGFNFAQLTATSSVTKPIDPSPTCPECQLSISLAESPVTLLTGDGQAGSMVQPNRKPVKTDTDSQTSTPISSTHTMRAPKPERIELPTNTSLLHHFSTINSVPSTTCNSIDQPLVTGTKVCNHQNQHLPSYQSVVSSSLNALHRYQRHGASVSPRLVDRNQGMSSLGEDLQKLRIQATNTIVDRKLSQMSLVASSNNLPISDLSSPNSNVYSVNTNTLSHTDEFWMTSHRPCHRPKGQSASFDDWISTSRVRELCEHLTNGSPGVWDHHDSMLFDSVNDVYEKIALAASTASNYLSSTGLHDATNYAEPDIQPHGSRPFCPHPHQQSGEITSSERSPRQPKFSKPPETFVPTISFLPSTANKRTYATQDRSSRTSSSTI